MTEAFSNGYLISVDTTHLPEMELNPPYKHFFSYQITIKNLSNQPGQLVSRFWEIVDKHQVDILYTAPTAIRSLMGFGSEPFKHKSLKSLKMVCRWM